jgi:hypothetical protein
LATSKTTYKIPFHPTHQYTVEVKCRPTIPDNIRYWQVFGNDDQIEDFLQCKNEFECTNIDLENDDDVNKFVSETGSVNNIDSKELNENKVDADELNENEIDSCILQLKNNVLPRGLVLLQDLFDFNDVAKKPKIEASGKEVEE